MMNATPAEIRCLIVATHRERSTFVAVMRDGAAAMFDLEGKQVGERLQDRVESSARIALHPNLPLIYVGDFGRKLISAYDALTGNRMWEWHVKAEIADVDVRRNDGVIVSTFQKWAVELHPQTGLVMRRWKRVLSTFVSPRSATIGLIRGSSWRGPLRFEFRHADETATRTTGYQGESFSPSCTENGRTWVFTEHPFGNVFGYVDGQLAWVYPDPGFLFYTLIRADEREVVMLRASRERSPSLDAIVRLDISTGARIALAEFPHEHHAREPADGGRVLVSRSGVLSVDDLSWRPFTLLVR